MSERIGPTLLIFTALILTLLLVYLVDYWHRKRVKAIFQRFSANQASRLNRESRSVPRVAVPSSFDVVFTIDDERWEGRSGRVVDLSLSGLAVEPNFPLKVIPQNFEVNGLEIQTPINRFRLDRVRAIRVEHHFSKRLLAFQIVAVEAEQFEEFKRFIVHLDAFSNT